MYITNFHIQIINLRFKYKLNLLSQTLKNSYTLLAMLGFNIDTKSS